MALKIGDLPDNEHALLVQIKAQLAANKSAHDDYVAARDSGDKAGMDINKPSFDAYENYAQQYREEAARLGVSGEPDDEDVPAASTQPSERDFGRVPAKPDKDAPAEVLDAHEEMSGK